MSNNKVVILDGEFKPYTDSNALPVTDTNSVTYITDETSGDTVEVNSSGQLSVETEDNRQLLNNILKELKKMNLQLAILTDNIIDKTEVE